MYLNEKRLCRSQNTSSVNIIPVTHMCRAFQNFARVVQNRKTYVRLQSENCFR
jgi:hypothetical protein